MATKMVILGAGLAGAGAARELGESVVYEAKEHVGGHVYSHQQGGLWFDEGAHICHAKDAEWKSLIFANAGQVREIAQSRVGNYWHGLWLSYPVQNHLRDLPEAFRREALQQILACHANEQPAAEHYEAWCRSQYGDLLTDRFYAEYTTKYWRTPMREMDTDWLAGRLLPSQLERIKQGAEQEVEEKQSVFSAFYYPEQGGFFAFFKPFYDGLDLRTGHRLVHIDTAQQVLTFENGHRAPYEQLISTIPLPDLIKAMDEVPQAIRDDVKQLRHTQMLGVNILVNRPQLTPLHWFYIYDADIDVSRVKVMSNVIPDSTPSGKTVLQAEIFRRDDEVLDADRLKVKAVEDLGRILSFDPEREVEWADTVEVSHSYVIPTLGRQAAVDRICAWLETKGIVSGGLYGRWKYVWSDQAYQSGRELAAELNR